MIFVGRNGEDERWKIGICEVSKVREVGRATRVRDEKVAQHTRLGVPIPPLDSQNKLDEACAAPRSGFSGASVRVKLRGGGDGHGAIEVEFSLKLEEVVRAGSASEGGEIIREEAEDERNGLDRQRKLIMTTILNQGVESSPSAYQCVRTRKKIVDDHRRRGVARRRQGRGHTEASRSRCCLMQVSQMIARARRCSVGECGSCDNVSP